MSLLARASAGVINTWGFAYVGGIVGLFNVSLLSVEERVEANTRRPPATALGGFDRTSGCPSRRSPL